MAQLLVRGLESDVKERLRRRATRHGHSMEAEVRDILRAALKDDRIEVGLGTRIAERFRGIGLGSDEEIRPLRGFSIDSPFEG